MIGVLLLAICISVSAVSADEGWSFNFSSSDSTNSDGGSVQVNNNELTIQGVKFTIPDGYKENETAKKVGEDYKGDQGLKISTAEFDKDDAKIIISAIFGDEKLDNNSYTPANESVAKKLADQEGWLAQYDNGVSFNYIKDGKVMEIFAPDEATLTSLIKSANS